ncbi:MAG: hypothetical protein MR442_09515 [Lachnospiraceae bacterium]|nr:hypothetical protein [Lachnospiraceae bacterium]
MHILLSYSKSHIYELHAILAATVTVLTVQAIKRPIKKKIADWVAIKAQTKERWEEKEKIYCKRANIMIVLLAFVSACLIYQAVTIVSPLIDFSIPTTILSGVFTLAEYAFLDQMLCGWERWSK